MFLWHLCMLPDEAGLNRREHVETYLKTKSFTEVKAKLEAVDMYEVLEKAAADRTKADLELLGLPGHMDCNDWILELND